MKEKFAAYDDAINILARTVSNLYPASYRASVSSDTIPIAAGEIISVNGQRYIVDAASVDGNTGTATLTLYDSPEDTPRISTLSEGDTVTFDGGTFTVNTVSQQGDTGIMYDYITHCIKFTPHP